MPKALLSCLHLQRNFEDFRHIYEEAGVEPVLPEVAGQQLAADEMRKHIVGMDCVIAGDDEIDASVLDAGKESGLKAVIKWGIGTDSIDKPHASRIGIPVFNTPGVFANEVADLGLSLFLNLTRGTHLMHNSIAEGGWRKIEGRSLTGLTAGVLGLGSIGLAIADRARSFGMHPVGYDVRQLSDEELGRHAIEQLPLDDVLARADALFVACNLTPENRHMLSREAFGKMKPGAYIVNVARGPLIDEAALADALQSGHIGGAGLDVFENEPLPADSRLRTFENCVFSTHNGSNTREAVARINQMTTEILLHVLGLAEATFEPNRVA
ncbi:phosphoglycerate dehydrogenase [Methyloligella solikamskensis]|uniref:Phosphoglycerate dehydrogenase n=1 Tax=Methyloligella solikamskensis TaxID=1177756 RepID=A0ABW3JBH4_9HYPH